MHMRYEQGIGNRLIGYVPASDLSNLIPLAMNQIRPALKARLTTTEGAPPFRGLLLGSRSALASRQCNPNLSSGSILLLIPRRIPLRVSLLLLLPLFHAVVAVAIGPAPSQDTLTFSNGDSLTGKLDREVAGTVYFKSDELGELKIPWSRIKSLHTAEPYAVLETQPKVHVRRLAADAIQGTVSVEGDKLTVKSVQAAALSTQLPVQQAQFIVSEPTFQGQVVRAPGLLQGWNGSLSGGITVVRGTQNQYTYTSSVALARTVPTVDWLPTRNRSTLDFSSSYGRITQPAYESGGTPVAASFTKSAIYHGDAERDQYISTRVFLLTQTAFDHNYSQGLDLQQIYGAGAGITLLKSGRQQLDLKAALQYEKQAFITAASGTNQNLIGSTFSVNYTLKLPGGLVIDQLAEYLPAFNVTRAYSATESDTLKIPFYKELAFEVGTIDSYLNDPVPASPPTKRNSFQFITGVTYTIKSRY